MCLLLFVVVIEIALIDDKKDKNFSWKHPKLELLKATKLRRKWRAGVTIDVERKQGM